MLSSLSFSASTFEHFGVNFTNAAFLYKRFTFQFRFVLFCQKEIGGKDALKNMLKFCQPYGTKGKCNPAQRLEPKIEFILLNRNTPNLQLLEIKFYVFTLQCKSMVHKDQSADLLWSSQTLTQFTDKKIELKYLIFDDKF